MTEDVGYGVDCVPWQDYLPPHYEPQYSLSDASVAAELAGSSWTDAVGYAGLDAYGGSAGDGGVMGFADPYPTPHLPTTPTFESCSMLSVPSTSATATCEAYPAVVTIAPGAETLFPLPLAPAPPPAACTSLYSPESLSGQFSTLPSSSEPTTGGGTHGPTPLAGAYYGSPNPNAGTSTFPSPPVHDFQSHYSYPGEEPRRPLERSESARGVPLTTAAARYASSRNLHIVVPAQSNGLDRRLVQGDMIPDFGISVPPTPLTTFHHASSSAGLAPAFVERSQATRPPRNRTRSLPASTSDRTFTYSPSFVHSLSASPTVTLSTTRDQAPTSAGTFVIPNDNAPHVPQFTPSCLVSPKLGPVSPPLSATSSPYASTLPSPPSTPGAPSSPRKHSYLSPPRSATQGALPSVLAPPPPSPLSPVFSSPEPAPATSPKRTTPKSAVLSRSPVTKSPEKKFTLARAPKKTVLRKEKGDGGKGGLRFINYTASNSSELVNAVAKSGQTKKR
ncbi:WetA [Pseudohyphozyma bogoriensis]|nr:WetA [Pseudohyphozyma bogoriensis]